MRKESQNHRAGVISSESCAPALGAPVPIRFVAHLTQMSLSRYTLWKAEELLVYKRQVNGRGLCTSSMTDESYEKQDT